MHAELSARDGQTLYDRIRQMDGDRVETSGSFLAYGQSVTLLDINKVL